MSNVMEAPQKSVSLIETTVQKVRVATAEVIVIKTTDDYLQAGEFLKTIKAAQGQVEEFFDDDIKKAHELHKSLTTKKKIFMDPLIEAERFVKQARIAYDAKQEELRRKEQEKLDAEAREKERKAKEKLDREAQKALEKGDTAKAEELLEKKEQIVVQAPVAAQRTQEVAGISKRKVWKAQVTDLFSVVKAVAEGRLPLAILEVSQSNLNKHAALIKDSQKIEGVRFYEETIENVR